ncbi:hypothetical protein C8Q76DRAFT_791227 [Earliella scabrosa]|nr:hypothetical protein C8Q76DRAFT_791227 [Earliella scabrosa]
MLDLLQNFFSVRVSGPDRLPPDTPHIHTHPPWPTPEQKIIAVKYQTTRKIRNLWPHGKSDSSSSPSGETPSDHAPIYYRLDWNTTVELVKECDRRLEQWGTCCAADENFPFVHERSFRNGNPNHRSKDSVRSNMSKKSTRSRRPSRAATPMSPLYEVGNTHATSSRPASTKSRKSRKASKTS